MDNATQVRSLLAEVEGKLNEQLPGLPKVLRDIHKQLKADPEIATILTEEECSMYVRGLKEQTKVEITTTKPKGRTSGAAKKKLDPMMDL